jgi:hypothetical protein
MGRERTFGKLELKAVSPSERTQSAVVEALGSADEN